MVFSSREDPGRRPKVVGVQQNIDVCLIGSWAVGWLGAREGGMVARLDYLTTYTHAS